MKQSLFGVIIELIISVIIIIFIPIMLFGLESEKQLRMQLKERTGVFTESICNQHRITENTLARFYSSLEDTGLICNVNIEVIRDEGMFSHELITEQILLNGQFELGDRDYVEVIVAVSEDTLGVRLARAVNPLLPKGWMRIIDSGIVYGGRT